MKMPASEVTETPTEITNGNETLEKPTSISPDLPTATVVENGIGKPVENHSENGKPIEHVKINQNGDTKIASEDSKDDLVSNGSHRSNEEIFTDDESLTLHVSEEEDEAETTIIDKNSGESSTWQEPSPTKAVDQKTDEINTDNGTDKETEPLKENDDLPVSENNDSNLLMPCQDETETNDSTKTNDNDAVETEETSSKEESEIQQEETSAAIIESPAQTPASDDNKENTENMEIIQEIDKILKDEETDPLIADANSDEFSDETDDSSTEKPQTKKIRKKKSLRKTLKTKKIKISKTFVEKWRAVKQAESERNEKQKQNNEALETEEEKEEQDIPQDEQPIENNLSSENSSNELESKTIEQNETTTKNEEPDVSQDSKDVDNKETIATEPEGDNAVSKKRQHQEDTEVDSTNFKKIKTSLECDVDQKVEKKEFIKLDSFREFLENKFNKLTRRQLEEYCIQKICEVLGQNSEIGELRHQIKRQEQMLETWRAKVIAISKQTRDLEIVKSRLVQDLKAKENGKIQEINPIKITRSVGLQVGTARPQTQAPVIPEPQKRKPRQSLPAKPIQTTPTQTPVPSRSPITTTPKPAKTIKTITPVRPATKEPNPTPMLNKALSKPAAPLKTVIDLTDEDETKTTPITAMQNGVRLVPAHTITTPAVSTATSLVATSVSGPRLTYLVTPTGQQPQQVMLHTFTNNGAPRPGQARNQIIYKPLQTNNASPQRLGSIRLPGNQVLVNSPQRATGPIRVNNIATLQRPLGPVRPVNHRNQSMMRHPAPLPGPPPLQPSQPTWKAMPPKPSLKLSRVGDGIVLSWRILTEDLSRYEEIASYQLYAYQETNAPPNTEMWRKVGDVKALALPMACTLTQFTDKHKYHFAVRAVDVKSRVGPFSQPEQITPS